MRKICKECANYDHKNLKHSKVCLNCVTEHYKDGTESDPSNWRALPQTNADRLRAMSDEELAKLIAENAYTGACNDFGIPHQGKCCHNCERCDAIIKWLKQPAE